MAEIRTIVYTVTDQLTLTPTATQEAGVQGDDRATAVQFQLPTALTTGYHLRLMMEDGRGGIDATDELTIQGSSGNQYVSYTLPLSWTQHGGEIKVRLMAFVGDYYSTVTQAAYSFEGRLRFRDKTTFVQKVGTNLQDTLVEVLAKIEDAITAASTAIAACGGAENSEYVATKKAEAAAASASSAADSKTAAQTAAETAAAKATAAAESTTTAAAAKTAAESAKTAAAGSATAAAGSASAAASSAETAAAAAANAANSETAAIHAKTAAETAKESAENAQVSTGLAATAAGNSATTAAAAAETATAKAAAAAASAASMRMQLIGQVTTTEEVAKVTFSADGDGAAFALDRFCVIAELPSAVSVSNSGMRVRCNNSSNYYAYYQSSTASVKFFRCYGENLGGTSSDNWLIQSSAGSKAEYGNPVTSERSMEGVATITTLEFILTSIPAGATIRLYGRKV